MGGYDNPTAQENTMPQWIQRNSFPTYEERIERATRELGVTGRVYTALLDAEIDREVARLWAAAPADNPARKFYAAMCCPSRGAYLSPSQQKAYNDAVAAFRSTAFVNLGILPKDISRVIEGAVRMSNPARCQCIHKDCCSHRTLPLYSVQEYRDHLAACQRAGALASAAS